MKQVIAAILGTAAGGGLAVALMYMLAVTPLIDQLRAERVEREAAEASAAAERASVAKDLRSVSTDLRTMAGFAAGLDGAWTRQLNPEGVSKVATEMATAVESAADRLSVQDQR
ncbi:MAG: hypothetical protein ICCCNLDF_02802 [Planctomycetes bacterium]|nr:hypothetical protein [Planctomycetota bacterium]